jgi:site-specific recombinase XerD
METPILRLIVNNQGEDTFEDQVALRMAKFCKFLLVQHGLKSNTINGYRKIARKFLEGAGILEPNHEQVTNYMVNVYGQEYSYHHITNTALGIERYMEFIKNPIKLGRPRKPQRVAKQTMTEAEVAIILDATKNLREKAMLALLAYSGIRNHELCNIRVCDVDFGNNEVMIFGKGSKERIVNIDGECTKVLMAYLAKFPRSENNYLFTTRYKDNQYSTWAVRRLVKVVAARTKIKKRVYPHLFRHSLATNLTDRGANPRTIQKQLGHAFLDTTMLYVESRPARVKAEYHAFSPSYL